MQELRPNQSTWSCQLLGMLTALATLGCWSARSSDAGHPVPFDVQLLTVDANEGCDIADFDGDGKLDVVAGRSWYRNGEWIPRPLRTIEDWNGYVESNGDFAYDVNGDGQMDVVAGSYIPTTVYWYENPGPEKRLQGYLWPRHMLVDTGLSSNEGSFLRDLNGDGVPEWITDSWDPNNPMIIWRLDTETREVDVQRDNQTVRETREVPLLRRHVVGESGQGGQGHGMAFGDINNDGREDILVGTGWYERPAGDIFTEPWPFHADWNLHASVPCIVRDFDEDGRSDLLWAKGHDYGLYLWHGRSTDDDDRLTFEEQIIDDSYSQPHCLHMADLDGDGTDEIITGKRVRAHNGNDPGGKEPPLVCYYVRNAQTGTFTRHIINDGDVGIGLQIRTADLDADGDTDIVLAGKEGTQILWNRQRR